MFSPDIGIVITGACVKVLNGGLTIAQAGLRFTKCERGEGSKTGKLMRSLDRNDVFSPEPQGLEMIKTL